MINLIRGLPVESEIGQSGGLRWTRGEHMFATFLDMWVSAHTTGKRPMRSFVALGDGTAAAKASPERIQAAVAWLSQFSAKGR